MINENDIYYILNKTKLTIKNLVLLLEEERDFNLLLYSIASSLSKEDLADLSELSSKLRLILVVYYCSHVHKMDFNESVMINELLLHNYNFFFRKAMKLDTTQPAPIISLCKSLKSGSLKPNQKSLVFKDTPNLLNNFNKWVMCWKDIESIILGVTSIK